jgi:ABC-type Mn2+/Zn2+ transport system ATPase subunit
MREPVVDADFRLEMETNMKLSETERALVCYVPQEIQNDTHIISETYQWIAYGEEWQRENIDMRKDYSKNYLSMLEKILMRKLIIYAHAEQTLIGEE